MNNKQLELALIDLDEVIRNLSTPNWDGYNAEPISSVIIDNAIAFIRLIPKDVHTPFISADPNGSIIYKWYKDAECILSVTVDVDSLLCYSNLKWKKKWDSMQFNKYTKELSKKIVDVFEKFNKEV